MVTFNFTANPNDVQIRVQTTSYGDPTVVPIVGPASLTTAPAGVTNPVTFTITGSSTWYSAVFRANSDELDVRDGQPSVTGQGTVTLDWTDGAGNSALVNPIANLGQFSPGEAIWTNGGVSVGAVQNGVQFNGVVTGIRFVTQNAVTMSSLDGTLACFAAGTRIATPSGETLVEDLSIGDVIADVEGRPITVKWIGRETTDLRFGMPDRRRPVKISAGALGENVPDQDWVVTADHALLVDGMLVTAQALVNGTSVDLVPLAELPATFTVYHIETEGHEIILANGAPAETYIDYISRQAFDNYAEYLELYGDEAPIAELALPRISSVRMLPASIRDLIGLTKAA